MKELSYIYSVCSRRTRETELQLCLTHEELARLRSYCSRKDTHRQRGFLQGHLSIGRDLYAALPKIEFQKQDIKNETLWLFDSRALKDVDHYTFYRHGIIIQPIDSQYQHFNTATHTTGELIIECDRYKFECFFQFLKAFSMGYWGDIFYFSPQFVLSTCIHDAGKEDMAKLNPDL